MNRNRGRRRRWPVAAREIADAVEDFLTGPNVELGGFNGSEGLPGAAVSAFPSSKTTWLGGCLHSRNFGLGRCVLVAR